MRARRALPVPDATTEPYWRAAGEHRLELQRCSRCGAYHHPPVPQCDRCRSLDLGWAPVSGRGLVHQRTVMHEPRVAGFEQAVPYAVVTVELEEQPGLLLTANVIDRDPGEVAIGMAVVVAFEDLEGGRSLPQFRAAGA